MDIEAIRSYCLNFSHTSEVVQWGGTLCFKVDGKLFVVVSLEPGPARLAFKASPENFVELCERPGIIPAPYMARAQWVSLERLNTLSDSDLRELISEAYELVFQRLPKKRQLELRDGAPSRSPQKTSSRPATGGAKKKAAKTPSKKAGKSPAGKKPSHKLAGRKKSAKARRSR